MTTFIFDGFEFENGDLIFVRDKFSLIGALIRNAQGDFDYQHVCSFWFINGEPKILTTGARFDWSKMDWVYGMVDAKPYLQARSYAVGRRTDLTPIQQFRRMDTLLKLEYRKAGYAEGKVIRLAIKGRTTARVVNQLNKTPDLFPTQVFCAESEAYGIGEGKRADVGFNEALATINSKYPKKKEYCTHTPETLFDSPETSIQWVVDR
jgi:hypothetical protein